MLTRGLERANGGMEFTMFPPSTVARAKMRVYGLHAPFSSSEAVLPVPVPLLSRPTRLAVAGEGQGMGCPTAEAARTRTNPAILIVRECYKYTDSLVRVKEDTTRAHVGPDDGLLSRPLYHLCAPTDRAEHGSLIVSGLMRKPRIWISMSCSNVTASICDYRTVRRTRKHSEPSWCMKHLPRILGAQEQ